MTLGVSTYFHCSTNKFDYPRLDLMDANRENHPNGALGLWFGLKPEWLASFGEYLYSFEVLKSCDSLVLSISILSKWARNQDFDYRAKRDELLARGIKTLLVQEIDGRIDMGIVLDFDCIQNWKREVRNGDREHS